MSTPPSTDSQPPEGLQPTISDDDQSRHPQAFQVLYNTYRYLDCPTAVDPADPDDCASVAEESVRVLMQAGLLPPPGGEVSEELGVQIAFTDNWTDGYFTASLYSPADEALARENAARHAAMEGRPARVARRMVGPWSPVLSDNSEATSV